MPKASKPPAQIKGIAALLGDDEPESPQELPLNAIDLSENQPRRYFDPERMERLIQSVREKGILEPVLVRPVNGRYELIAGERRYRAAQSLKLDSIPVVVREMTNTEALEVALIENLQREDLNPIEETEGVLTLLSIRFNLAIAEIESILNRLVNQATGKITSNVTGNDQQIEALLSSLGINAISFTTNRLPLLKLPDDIKKTILEGKLEYTKARAIAKIRDEEKRQLLLQQALHENLSLTQIKNAIAAIAPPSASVSGSESSSSFRSKISQTLSHAKKAKLSPHVQKEIEAYLEKIQALLTGE